MIRLSRMVLGAALIAAVSASTVRAAEPDKLLPANTDSILVVNVPQILGSEIVKKYALEQLKQMLDGQDAKKLLGDLGLDPLKDVETVTFATCDTKIKDIENTQKLAIIRGTFDAEKLFKTAEARSKKEGDKFEMVKDGNTVMFKIQPDNNQPPWYATVVNDKTVIAASEKKLVSATVAAAAASKAAPIKKELADLIKKFDAKTSVFAATLLKGKLDDQKLPAGQGMPFKLDGLEKLLPKMETATISVKVGADVNAEVTIGMKDAESATDLQGVLDEIIKQVKPLAMLVGASDPRGKPLGDILNTVKTSTKSTDVIVVGKLTGDNIGKMVNPNGE